MTMTRILEDSRIITRSKQDHHQIQWSGSRSPWTRSSDPMARSPDLGVRSQDPGYPYESPKTGSYLYKPNLYWIHGLEVLMSTYSCPGSPDLRVQISRSKVPISRSKVPISRSEVQISRSRGQISGSRVPFTVIPLEMGSEDPYLDPTWTLFGPLRTPFERGS